MHACDFVDDNGEEISTSLMPEYVQLSDEVEEAPASEEAAQTEEAPAAEEVAAPAEEAPAQEAQAEQAQAVEEAPAPKSKAKGKVHSDVSKARNTMASANADMDLATQKVEKEAAARSKAFALSQ